MKPSYSATSERYIALIEKGRKKSLHPVRIHLLSKSKRRVFEAEDLSKSLKVCLHEIAKGFDRTSQLLSNLTDSSGWEIRSVILDNILEIVDLAKEYTLVFTICIRSQSSLFQKHFGAEMDSYWEGLQAALGVFQYCLTGLETSKIQAINPLVQMVLSICAKDIRKNMEHSELPLGVYTEKIIFDAHFNHVMV